MRKLLSGPVDHDPAVVHSLLQVLLDPDDDGPDREQVCDPARPFDQADAIALEILIEALYFRRSRGIIRNF